VIDAHPLVLLEAQRPVVPPGVDDLVGVQRPHDVGEPELADPLERLPLGRADQHRALPRHRIMNVHRRRRDVVVAADRPARVLREPRGQVGPQPLHPRQLVRVLLRAHGLAVRHVRRRHPHPVDRRHQEPRLRIVDAVAEAPLDLLRRSAREERHAVVRLLPVRDDVVAQRPVRLDGEPRILGLDLLKAQDIWPLSIDPRQQPILPCLDAVDVPGRDLHRPKL
jgi:hypothetical protein